MTDINEAIKTAFLWGSQERQIARPDGGMSIIAPEGSEHLILPPLEKPLTRVEQVVTLHDASATVAYLKQFGGRRSRIFSEPGFLSGRGVAMIHGIIDYHNPSDDGPVEPDRLAHQVIYSPRYSEQWSRWMNACKAEMTQVQFAEFIEENRGDIVEPAAANLLDVVRAFKASKKVEFDSVVYQPNGDVKLVYDEKTEQKGTSGTLPEKLKLGIPVYFRDAPFAVEVFVRYRVGSGAVKFQLKLDRPDVIEDEAFKLLSKKISDETGIAMYLGRVR